MSTQWTIPRYQSTSVFPLHPDPGGMLSRSVRMLSRNDKPTDIWDTHAISGNVFVNPLASSSSPYPHRFNPWISNVSEHTSPHVTSERQNPDTALDPRFKSGPSARGMGSPGNRRSDNKPTIHALTSLRQENGGQNTHIPKNERTRQRPFDEGLPN